MNDRDNPLINAARGRNACGINHDELTGALEYELEEGKKLAKRLAHALRICFDSLETYGHHPIIKQITESALLEYEQSTN